MNLRWVGAILIICASGFAGFSISAAFRLEESELRQLIAALEQMERELKYRMTPLPELCRIISAEQHGYVAKIFRKLADMLDSQTSPDVQSCLAAAAAASGQLPPRLQQAICILGASLGRFDLEGQIQGIESVCSYCRGELEQMALGRDARLRSYQTLGLCAGAALAILLV